MLNTDEPGSAKKAQCFEISKEDLKQLFHVFSHDLRNPLVNMDALLRDTVAACRQSDAANHQDMRENLAMMQEVVQRMNGLIHGVNDIYHAMFDTLHHEEVDIVELLALEVARCQQGYACAERISFSVQAKGVFWADPMVLRRIVAELMDNAVYALSQSHESGNISIENHKRRGFDVLSVRDSGGGIGESDMNYIFQPFFSLHHAPGLGLARVKAWLQAHGGRIWCESKADVGSIFYIALPEKNGVK